MREDEILPALKDKKAFKEAFKYACDLRMAAEKFPEGADALFEAASKDSDVFKHVFKDAGDLYVTVEKFPQYGHALFQAASKDTDVFKHVFKSACDLRMTAEKFPEGADALFEAALKDTDVFKHFFEDTSDLDMTAEKFPQYAAIFGKPSVEEAAQAGREYVLRKISHDEIKKNALVIDEESRDLRKNSFSLFSLLPTEVNVRIAAHTRDSAVHSEKEAVEIAINYFNKT